MTLKALARTQYVHELYLAMGPLARLVKAELNHLNSISLDSFDSVCRETIHNFSRLAGEENENGNITDEERDAIIAAIYSPNFPHRLDFYPGPVPYKELIQRINRYLKGESTEDPTDLLRHVRNTLIDN